MSISEKEIQLEYDKNFFIGSLQWKKGNMDHDDLKSFMPDGSIFSVVDKDTFELMYICKDGQDVLNKNLEEIKARGAGYTREITHPESVKRIFPQWQHYYRFGDHYRPFIRFQKIRSSPDLDYFTVRTSKLVNQEKRSFLNMHNLVTH